MSSSRAFCGFSSPAPSMAASARGDPVDTAPGDGSGTRPAWVRLDRTATRPVLRGCAAPRLSAHAGADYLSASGGEEVARISLAGGPGGRCSRAPPGLADDDMRLTEHPILPGERARSIRFTFRGQELPGHEGETISAALFAAGIRVFGRHPKDNSPQGIFCANGQCAQCMVIVDGEPVKSCMQLLRDGMVVEPAEGLPVLPPAESPPPLRELERVAVPVLIIGGGPAGMSAALELGRRGVRALLVDDKHRLGGKLVLQTHRFFGSIDAVYAGTRGTDIATRLEASVNALDTVDVWLNATVLGVFSDRGVGVLRGDGRYVQVEADVMLVAAGARERSLTFIGNTLPGVYGAGAFQTLVNRDLVKAADRLFIVGGGNVGLIAGYHALQAGIDVVGLCEALPECGGYKVHRDKLARLGVPIYTSHTIIAAHGDERVESVTIAAVDEKFRAIPGTERSFACDTVLVAVGLDPVDEFYHAAQRYGMKVHAAGDAQEIAEASAAIFSGKMAGLEIARELGVETGEIPDEWSRMAEVLKSKPGARAGHRTPEASDGVFPVFHCSEEIPCNPCTSVCPQQLIWIDPSDIRGMPEYLGHVNAEECLGCERCVVVCPGLAVTLVDYRMDPQHPTVTMAWEFPADSVTIGQQLVALDEEGAVLGTAEVVDVQPIPRGDRTVILKLRVPAGAAKHLAGVQKQDAWVTEPLPEALEPLVDEQVVCRCERVTAGEIRDLIRRGYRDMNEIKAVTRAGMGACGGKTCGTLVARLFREEGVADSDVVRFIPRPLFVEVPLGVFAGADPGGAAAGGGREALAPVSGNGRTR
jgi:sarcosine oxidase, subunit alpha